MDEITEILGNEQRLLARMLAHAQQAEEEGDWIGPYRLIECIGEGGFGMVWRAEQEEPVRREVALKVIKLGMDTAQVLGRFHLERQALASLEHPHIATLLDAGASPDGRPYFAMELVQGGTITQCCEVHHSTLEERLRLFIQVSLAVHHAHEKGILHRDLKPSNVLMTEIDAQPVPKVIDFGIAKAMGGDLMERSLLTQANQAVGTPLYMSPEQIAGSSELDARSDVYALGVLLYELLTGLTPFAQDKESKGGVEAVKQAVLQADPERPSTRLRRQRTKSTASGRKPEVTRGLASFPGDLDWITLRALEKRRERRYPSAAELAADVRRHLESRPVMARGPNPLYKARRWANRHRRMLMTACVGIFIGTLAFAVPKFFESKSWRSTYASMRRAWSFKVEVKAGASPAQATSGQPYENTLGMRFAPVPIMGGPTNGQRVLFSIWTTRIQDYEGFINKTHREWTRTQFEQGPDHPAVMMTWDDARAFCEWLTMQERAAGQLGEDQVYRLPSDHEWSCAVGIGQHEDPALPPRRKSSAIPNVYPWGTEWPPPDSLANYLSDETKTLFMTNRPVMCLNISHPFPDYHDGYALTAPVGSYAPNALALYDLSGNVWQWCEDLFGEGFSRTIRGASWGDFRKESMMSSSRGRLEPKICLEHLGFRVVLASTSSLPAASKSIGGGVSIPPRFLKAIDQAEARQQVFTNTLGMQFLPVPATNVLFCIHETRVQDYAAHAAEVKVPYHEWEEGHHRGHPAGREEDHPILNVRWQQAQDFCTWLSTKEDKKYRLPTDAEWSMAVGLEKSEKTQPGMTPKMLESHDDIHFPWGTHFPPMDSDRAGNFADSAWHKVFPDEPWIEGLNDGFTTTAPVMSFQPNARGLYDMAGNVEEFCEDWYDGARTARVARGSCYMIAEPRERLRSSTRGYVNPSRSYSGTGFRIVLEPEEGTPQK